MLSSGLATVDEISAMITSGRVLLLAGEAPLLAMLPEGKWVGGTTSNFIVPQGGLTDRSHIYYNDITGYVSEVDIRSYTSETLHTISSHYPQNGFTVVIVPGMSEILTYFAKTIPDVRGVFNAPLVGWVAGVHLNDIGKVAPRCFSGNGRVEENAVVAMHVTLPSQFTAQAGIINLFTQDEGPVIEFLKEGFYSEEDCLIDGTPQNLAHYIHKHDIDTRLPLVANYNGAMINVSIQNVDDDAGIVKFYAPFFKGIQYHFAKPVENYKQAFAEALSKVKQDQVLFSCNCILNYCYAGMEGRQITHGFVGPITFGEIAYILLNQTLAYITISKT